MPSYSRGTIILILAAIVNAGTQPGNDPCDEAGILDEGINDVAGLPIDYTDSTETSYLEWICFGFFCDPGPCLPSFEIRWAEYTATCTEAVSLTTYSGEDEIGPASLVSVSCDCPYPVLWTFGACPLDRQSITFLAVKDKCYKIAIFGDDTAVIEPLDDLTYICDYYWFGYYTGEFYDDVAAFVSCQADCDSPTCSKCFDADEDGAVTLRDFADFQNNAPW